MTRFFLDPGRWLGDLSLWWDVLAGALLQLLLGLAIVLPVLRLRVGLFQGLETRNRELQTREAQLSAQTAVLQATLDSMSDGISVVDRDLRLRLWNDRFSAVTGIPAGDLADGKPLDAVLQAFLGSRGYDGPALQTIVENLRASFRPGTPGVTRYLTREGREVEIRRQPMPDGGFVSTYTDVTEELAARRRLNDALRLLAMVMDAVPAAIHVKDRQLRYRMVNQHFLEQWHLSREQVLGHTARALFDDEDAEVHDRQVLETRARLPFYDTDRAEHRFWTTKIPLLDADGEVDYILTVDIDVSERLRAEQERARMQQALAESEERFRGIAEGHPVPVMIARMDDGRILYASPATKTLLGRPLTAILGSCVAEHLAAEDAPQLCAELRDKQRLDSHEILLRRADGSELPAALTLRRIVYDGQQAVVIGIVDLSERKAAEQQINEQREALHQSEKLNALGTLLAGVAHELNNPLSVVVGQALMLQEGVDDPAIRQRAERIGNAADRCSRIVKTFLAMARQSTPDRAAVDLNEVVASALELTSYALRSADIQVHLQLEPALAPVWGNADQLTQVLVNLIVNAEQAMARQPLPRRLSISTGAATGQGVRLVVADNGPGIDPGLRLRIFEPFFTTKAVGMGTGVGLAVSHGIIRAHEGQIRVDSEPGSGARFEIVLPRCQAAPPAPASAEPDAGSGPACRVLVVDDEPEVAAMVSDVLGLDGHRVHCVGSGNQALEYLRSQSVDLILSDIRMPDLDGPGLYSRLQQAFPALARRTAFITGDALGPAAKGFLQQQGLAVLEKPFTPGELRALVERLLAAAVA